MKRFNFILFLILSVEVCAWVDAREKSTSDFSDESTSLSADFQDIDPVPFLTFYEIFVFFVALLLISVLFCYPIIWSCVFAYEDSLSEAMFSPFQEFFRRIDAIESPA